MLERLQLLPVLLPIQAGIYWGWIHQKVTNAERYFARERCINHRFVASESTYVTPLNRGGSLEGLATSWRRTILSNFCLLLSP